jgi:hypothetical protein
MIEAIPVRDLFTTDLFKKAFEPGNWLANFFKDTPDALITEQKLPPGHFGTYFGCTPKREYDNPYVKDLYYLHEMTHWKMFKSRPNGYNPNRSFLEWSRWILQVEMEASLMSECFAYFKMPELRQHTFTHRIWADKYLPFDSYRQTLDDVRDERVRAMTNPDPFDFLEQQIHNYVQQNWAWIRIWAPTYKKVEEHMVKDCTVEEHKAWLESHTTNAGHPQFPRMVPFLAEANMFEEEYRKSQRSYSNSFLVR